MEELKNIEIDKYSPDYDKWVNMENTGDIVGIGKLAEIRTPRPLNN